MEMDDGPSFLWLFLSAASKRGRQKTPLVAALWGRLVGTSLVSFHPLIIAHIKIWQQRRKKIEGRKDPIRILWYHKVVALSKRVRGSSTSAPKLATRRLSGRGPGVSDRGLATNHPPRHAAVKRPADLGGNFSTRSFVSRGERLLCHLLLAAVDRRLCLQLLLRARQTWRVIRRAQAVRQQMSVTIWILQLYFGACRVCVRAIDCMLQIANKLNECIVAGCSVVRC